MICKDCIHYEICCLWSTTDLDDDKAYEHCYGRFKNKENFKEIKHGYWKWEKKIEPQAQNRLYCSVCDSECLSKNNYYVKSEYCHRCGAKMDKESEN